MHSLRFEEFCQLCEEGNVIPVYASFLADLLTPVSAYLRLRTLSDQGFLLESVEGGEKMARYSFLGCHPFSVIQYRDHKIHIEEEGKSYTLSDNLFEFLKTRFREYRAVRPAGLPRFTGGAVGYFGYDCIRLIEDIPDTNPDVLDVPDALLMFYDTVLIFDHITHRIFIVAHVFLDKQSGSRKQLFDEARSKIAAVQKVLDKPLMNKTTFDLNGSTLSSNCEQPKFSDSVCRAKKYIEAGDIFQVVLSRYFYKTVKADPFDVYRALRQINPSPYLYFIQFKELKIIGSSPEMLVRVEECQVDVRPIAGTRRRGKNESEDRELMDELRSDEKENAEHVMLVDLGRNDVGRVSEYGSVEVNEFMKVEKYSHVMHLVSNVRGRLRPELTALDALKACFPAGTVSGAPKIRAMEIIDELETTRRGIYAGALGYLDFMGNMDTCIAIRTIVIKGQEATLQAGAGIVADSVPEREFEETDAKASVLRAAIECAERGLQ